MKREIVIIEDDFLSGLMCQKIIEGFGYKASLFRNGTDALKYFSNHQKKVDGILIDIYLPDGKGVHFFKLITDSEIEQGFKPSQKAIILEENQIEQNEEWVTTQGFNSIIRKPINASSISQFINQIETELKAI